MQDRYRLSVLDAKTQKPIINEQEFPNLIYIRTVLETDTELGWWARRRFIRNLRKTGLSTYVPRVTSDRYRIVKVGHWIELEPI